MSFGQEPYWDYDPDLYEHVNPDPPEPPDMRLGACDGCGQILYADAMTGYIYACDCRDDPPPERWAGGAAIVGGSEWPGGHIPIFPPVQFIFSKQRLP